MTTAMAEEAAAVALDNCQSMDLMVETIDDEYDEEGSGSDYEELADECEDFEGGKLNI